MKSEKVMLLGVVVMLLGLGMMPTSTYDYFVKHLGTDFITGHFTFISLVFLFVGFVVSVGGFFLGEK